MNATETYHLASFPRSGNTLVRLLLAKYFGVSVPSSFGRENILDSGSTGFLNRQAVRGVVFLKTHLAAPPVGEPRGILIIRDGRDTLVSVAHYNQDRDGDKRPFIDILWEKVRGPEYTQHHLCWLGFSRMAIVRYEDLVRSEEEAVSVLDMAIEKATGRRMAPFPRDGIVSDFESLHRENRKFFRRGIVGSWHTEMPDEIEDCFWKNHGEMMLRLGYPRGERKGS